MTVCPRKIIKKNSIYCLGKTLCINSIFIKLWFRILLFKKPGILSLYILYKLCRIKTFIYCFGNINGRFFKMVLRYSQSESIALTSTSPVHAVRKRQQKTIKSPKTIFFISDSTFKSIIFYFIRM